MQAFASTPAVQPRRRSATTAFLRHYGEMVLAMLVGMAMLHPALMVVDLESDAPALFLLAMAFAMSAPMVAWMRHRGHSWERGAEMAGSMFAPTLLAIALLDAGLLETTGALVIQHAIMFPAMLAVMLVRRDEYTGHHTTTGA